MLYRLGSPDSRTNLMAFRTDIDAILGHLPADLAQGIDTKTCCATCSTSR